MTDADIKSFMKGSVNLGKHSGSEFQNSLGLTWYPLDYGGGMEFERSISVYHTPYSSPLDNANKNLLKYRKMAVKKKGYFFHITGDKKDYVGFRKKSWNDETDIMYDLLEYFAEVPEEDKKW